MFTAEKERIKQFLLSYQTRLCRGIEAIDGKIFEVDCWDRAEGGGGRTSVLAEGAVIEKGGVNFSHVFGDNLPASASKIRPEIAGASFDAMGVSVVIHPRNPYVPTAHLNIRFFIAYPKNQAPVWWFGGGYDLTPYYLIEEDGVYWHQITQSFCDSFGKEVYSTYKKWADDYFYLPHRQEHRGIGGIFFDDLNESVWGWDFEKCFAFMQAVGNGYIESYLPIVSKRANTPYTEREKDFQRYRRGRYVEFNLIYDRGTLFGLQSNGRTESILMSLPPEVKWGYQYVPIQNTPESLLIERLKTPKAWV